MRSVALAKPSNQEAISRLRIQEYARAQRFAMDLQSLNWREADDQSYVLEMLEDDRVIATMRGELISDLDTLGHKLECDDQFPFSIATPVLILSRAATSSKHRGQGLNLVLRYWFLKFAKQHSIRYVMGTFVSDSPREETLKKMGYDFYPHTKGWNRSSYRTEHPIHIVSLDMQKKGDYALNYCETVLSDQLTQYNFSDLDSGLKYVRSI